MRVMIAGGGTGGHIYPGIAMYNALRRRARDVDVLFVGATAGVESKIFDELDLPNVLLPGRAVRGKGFVSKMTSPLVFLVGLIRGIREILAFQPDVVIGTGGYASVALVAASVLCRKTRVLQEQNSVPGMANRLLSRFADLVLLSYEESRVFIKGGVQTAVVGNPIRIEATADRESALRFFGLKSGVPTVLVCGGSRGARSINQAAEAAVKRIVARRDVQFVFLTGELDYEKITRELAEFSEMVRVYPFLQEMHYAYGVADIAVSRAGASAVFELAAFGIPTVFVPYPYAADDHQRKNVNQLEEVGAAIVIENQALDGEHLETIIETLLDDEGRRGDMQKKSRAWAKADADSLAAEKILELVSRRRAVATGAEDTANGHLTRGASPEWM
ncbi:MAG: undecaprenyldiphospho-muramoylpentapeptide beta-N-acetylglucosaminyltransferase [Candidatus Latescibacterota bacterium]|nr:MAG: undecaprenyldiphospho-muramoylpentapeptide beta-N-acetylglucosaminyltransferase [Candidatus Latescibacterota bacterium]